jgi:hypothetical protein
MFPETVYVAVVPVCERVPLIVYATFPEPPELRDSVVGVTDLCRDHE